MRKKAAGGMVFFSSVTMFITLLIWPTESYAQLVRYGTIPSLFTTLPYLLSFATLISAFYTGLYRTPRSIFLQALPAASVGLPVLTMGAIISHLPPSSGLAVVLYLYALALVAFDLGAMWSRLKAVPTLLRIGVWGAAILLLVGFLRYAPAFLPARVMTAVLEGGTSIRLFVTIAASVPFTFVTMGVLRVSR